MAEIFKNKEEKEIVIKYYMDKVRLLDEQIMDLEKEREIYNARISELSPESSIKILDMGKFLYYGGGEEIYSSSWTLVKKTEYVLSNVANMISTTREITEYINELEGGLFTESQKKEYISKLGATLIQKTEKKLTFSRVESTSGEFYYGLLNWFYSAGLVKMQYLNPKAKLKQIKREDKDDSFASWLIR